MNVAQKLAVISLCAIGLAIPAGPAFARGGEPGPVKKAAEDSKQAADKLKEKRKELKEELKEKRAAGKDGKEDAKEDVKDAKGEVKDARKELKENWAKLRETRQERRKERREELKKKWGELPKHPAVKSELKVHAWRMARLKRVRAVAVSEDKTDAVARVDKLVAKENGRHDKRMEALKAKGGEE
ncbi:MAG: hypothetical protein IPI67_22120 [Myxococcales bacterium]|nr:hypothetical protein [Myxococcales bacterium]